MENKGPKSKRFGDIAVYKNFVSEKTLQKALHVQKLVYKKSRVYAPIGKILVRMKAMTQRQIEEVLAIQNNYDVETQSHREPKSHSSSTQKKASPPSLPSKKEEILSKEVRPFRLKVSENNLFASLLLTKEGSSDLTPDDIISFLEKKGIIFGIVDKGRIKDFLESGTAHKRPLIIAKGNTSSPGQPPRIIYHFEVDPLGIGTIREDGTIDWKDRGKLPVVKKGELLAEKLPGKEGSPGTDIFGHIIYPPEMEAVALRGGTGVMVSDDGLRLFAACDGMPRLMADGSISVFPNINVAGDVCIDTGHIDFDGHVEVSGIVQKGYIVKAKSLRANGLEEARVDLVEDAVIMGGIYGSKVKVQGNLKASHVHNSNIDALGNMIVQKEIIESRIEINGRCLVEAGRIIDSEVIAKKGIIVHDIGSEGARPSTLTIGIDFKCQRAIDNLKNQIRIKRKKREEIIEHIDGLKEKLDQLETSLGELALEQDRYMVEERMLREKLQQSAGMPDNASKNKLDKAVKQLGLKVAQLDKDVANILDEEEKTEGIISDLENDTDNITGEIETLNSEIEVLSESLKIDRGVPVIKIYGEAQPGTLIIMPHCKYSLQKPLQRVMITESDKTKSGRWEYRILPLH